jgi:hypothetical protein
MTAADGPQNMVFVGGAPRSGTTVTHALLCTSKRVSDYHPEISFFRGLMIGFRNGRGAWKQHTSAFFADPEAFRLVMRESADVSMRHVWRALGASEILCMKDPLLTPFFPDLHQLYPREARFVVVVRHPYEVVRSRQEVHEKGGAQHTFGVADAAAAAREYLATYRAILAHNFSGKLFMFRYEDLLTEDIQAGLAKFIGVDDLDPGRMWGDGAQDLTNDAWSSPKYNKAIDLAPRLDTLSPVLAETVKTICAPIMQRFNYS